MSRDDALRPITRGPGDFAGFITDDDMVAVINQVYDDIPVSKDKPEYDNLVLKTGTTGMTGVFGWEQSAELNIGAATISEDGTGLRISPLSGDQDLFFDLNKKRWVFSAGPLGESPVEIHGPITQYVTPALDEHVTNKGYVDNEVSRKYEDGRAYTDERVSDTRLEINNKLDPLILRVDVIQDLVLSPDTPSLKVVEAEVKELGSRVLVLENAPPSSGGGTAGSGTPLLALDDLTDVDVSNAVPGMLLAKNSEGHWAGSPLPMRPLNWLSDVSTGTIDADGNPVAPDLTPPGYVLGTSGEGFWEPLSLAYIEEQIVTPLQQQIGDPRAVAAHTDLVGFIGEVDQRLSAIEVTPAVEAERHLFVDKYSGSFIRVMVVPPTGPWPAKVDFALATAPGVNGEVYPTLGDVPGGPAVYADFAGTLGRLYMADDTGVYGSTLKEWIRKGTIATVHRDDTDPAHPKLVVEKIEQPTSAGSSMMLDSLRDVTAPATTPAGKVLGTTAEGAWGAVDVITVAKLKELVDGAADWAAFKTAVAAL